MEQVKSLMQRVEILEKQQQETKSLSTVSTPAEPRPTDASIESPRKEQTQQDDEQQVRKQEKQIVSATSKQKNSIASPDSPISKTPTSITPPHTTTVVKAKIDSLVKKGKKRKNEDRDGTKERNALIGMSLREMMLRYRKFELETICCQLGLKRNATKEVLATRIIKDHQEQKSRTKNQEKRNANSPSMSQREKKKASNCRKEGSSTKRVEEESDSEAELESESEEEEGEEEEEDDEALDKQNKKHERNRESNKRRRPGHHRKTPKKRKY